MATDPTGLPAGVEIVEVPEHALACLRGRGAFGELPARVVRLLAALAAHDVAPAGPVSARFHDAVFDPADCDFEVCVRVEADADGWVPDAIGDAQTVFVPRHYAVAAEHRGPYDRIGPVHDALAAALATLGYSAAGPATEVYLTGPAETDDPSGYVTEVRVPYAR